MALAMKAKMPQDEEKKAGIQMTANANGSISLTFKGKPALLGNATPYYSIAGSGVCKKGSDGTVESMGGIRLLEPAKATENKNGTVRLDFEDGGQLLLKPAGEANGAAIVQPFGVVLGRASHDFIAGYLLLGDKLLEVKYMKQDSRKKTLADLADGTIKIKDCDAKAEGSGCKVTLTAERGDKIVLHIGPKKKDGFYEIEKIGVMSAIF
jgi:hypothetical protein